MLSPFYTYYIPAGMFTKSSALRVSLPKLFVAIHIGDRKRESARISSVLSTSFGSRLTVSETEIPVIPEETSKT